MRYNSSIASDHDGRVGGVGCQTSFTSTTHELCSHQMYSSPFESPLCNRLRSCAAFMRQQQHLVLHSLHLPHTQHTQHSCAAFMRQQQHLVLTRSICQHTQHPQLLLLHCVHEHATLQVPMGTMVTPIASIPSHFATSGCCRIWGMHGTACLPQRTKKKQPAPKCGQQTFPGQHLWLDGQPSTINWPIQHICAAFIRQQQHLVSYQNFATP